MKNRKKLPFMLLVSLMFGILLTISIGLSLWIISDSVVIKPSLDVDKVITQYLDNLSADYLKDTVFLPSDTALGLDRENEDLTYYYRLIKDSDGNDVSKNEENKEYALVEGKNGPMNAGTYEIQVKYVAFKDTNLEDGTNDSIVVTSEVIFVINKAEIKMDGISFDSEELTYDKQQHNITISGTLPKDENGNTLITNVSYTCNDKPFNGAKNVGTYNVTASFEYDINNYKPVAPKEATLKINAKSINLFDLSFEENSNNTFYTGTTLDDITDSLIIIDDDGEKLLLNDDYTVSYGNIVNLGAGAYTITITGVNNYDGQLIGNFIIKDKPINLIVTKKDTSSNFEKLTYNGSIQGPSVIVTNDEGTIIEDAVLTYTINDAIVEPKNVGTYNNIIVTASKTGYNSGSSLPIILQIEAAPITLQWSNTKSFEYNQKPQRPDYAPVSFFEGDDCTLTNPEGAINYGQHSVTISLSGKDASNYTITNATCTYNITKRPISLVNNEYGIDYDSSNRTWDSIKSIAASKLEFDDVLPGDSLGATVVGMHNGVYSYGTVSATGLQTTTNVVGSAYQATVLINNINYALTTNTFILKYKTVLVNSIHYTIEDAFNAGGSEIILVGNAADDAADNHTNYVLTSFSLILNKKEHSVYSKTLKVPYNSSGTILKRDYENKLVGVYSGLLIPNGITVNFYNSSVIACAIMNQGGKINRRGVIWNDGTMNFEESSSLRSYGFTKGNGSIYMKSGTTATDVFFLEDWPGADEAVNLKDKGAFPVQRWSVHNISCSTIYYKDAICKADSYVIAINGIVKIDVNDVYIIGASGTNKCLFKPNGGNSSDYIEKSAEIPSDTFEKSNQSYKQIDNIYIKGKYIDSNVEVKVKYIIDYSFATSTSMAVPINYYNITVGAGSTLEIVNASYVFMDTNASLVIEETGELFVNGNAYLAMRNGSTLLNNGKLQGSGTFGGNMESTVIGASSTISNYGCDSVILKTSSTAVTEYTQDATGFIGNSEVKDTSGNILVEEKYENNTFEDGKVYISKKSKDDDTYFFEGNSDYNTFTINYNTDGGNALAPTKIYAFEDSYVINHNDLTTATKDFYDFDYWYYKDANGNNVKLTEYTLSTSVSSITLYAAYTEHEYNFVYTGGYNINGTMTEVTTDMSLADNSFTTFTISNFVTVTVDGKEEKRLILPNAPSYSYNGSAKSFTGWYIGTIDKYDSTAFTYIRDTDLLEFISQYGDSTPIPVCCIFINAPVKVTIIDNDNKGVLNGNVNKLEFSFEQGGTLDSNNYSFEVNSGSLDSNIEYSKYFAGFVISGGDGTIYSLDDVLKMSISSNATFEVKWNNKAAITFNISGDISQFTYNSINYSANKTYYFMENDVFTISGEYNSSNFSSHSPTITGSGVSEKINKNKFEWYRFVFSATYTITSHSAATITCSF